MPDQRQADILLKRLKQNDKGKLTLFLGAAPGVGKTFAMLSAAKVKSAQGVNLLVGLVETHGREDTEQMLSGLPILPPLSIQYHSASIDEFDLDAALVRKPSLILVDELAHTNAPGSRNRFRYQDIEELLAKGIDVYSTVNIQHMASLNDLVLKVTGVRVQETVPDRVFDLASEIQFIDLPPDGLIERLQDGKVYVPDYARDALDRFFTRENLTALREMAVREVLVRVDSNLSEELMAKAKLPGYSIQDKLLVMISSNRNHDYLIRQGRQIADRRQITWYVLWVDTGRTLSTLQRARLKASLDLATELGAQAITLRGQSSFAGVVPFLQENRVSTVLVGNPAVKWRFWRKPLYQRLIEAGMSLEVSVYTLSEHAPALIKPVTTSGFVGRKLGYAVGAGAVVLATALAILASHYLSSGNLVLLYVAAVVVTGLRYGSRPALSAALLSFLSFNFFLTKPFYTFAVTYQDDVATLIFLSFIGIISGPAASRVRRQLILLNESSRFSESLRIFAESLTRFTQKREVYQQLESICQLQLKLSCSVVDKELLEPLSVKEQSAVAWVFANNVPAGRFYNTLSSLEKTFFPISNQQQVFAVAVVCFPSTATQISVFQQQLITALLQQAATTMHRLELSTALESSRLKAEVEQLRTALLSSVSHDLKSPLAAMIGAAETLKHRQQQLSAEDKAELIDALCSESNRLENYIQNLLDMTRLGYGTLKIERDWVQVSDIIGSAVQRLKRYQPDARVQVQLQQSDLLIYVHAALIEQALFNVLENAVRFNPQDAPVTIVQSVLAQDLLLQVLDQGPGVPEQDREHIFDMFFVVASGDSKKSNTGMGLAICKGMIGAHGGTVRVRENLSGKGACFELSLPLNELNQPELH
ncbi:sensor histidine kinase KdpD [Alkalimonas sp. MEB108]|uniref:histidine kinase n=1 Tax=Alkalimonas cellulosilytica TaxID=3058395 RepID=A0ABU7J4T7_9GAMM|nr:sensor histidine kinase KdpD [Alkalimonas sp. MEB108]MEE2001353.1 sensor histidine kinase KdpD [Alkalimonas sp. MEB108]